MRSGSQPSGALPLIELEIGAVGSGGVCLSRYDGRVVFVRHTLPGERVRAQVTEQHRSYWRADTVEVLTAAPERVPAPCRYSGRCGGCDWQHVDPATQRRHKGELLAGQLGNALGHPVAVEVEQLAGGALGWRSRVRFAVDSAGRPGLHPHRSHAVVALSDCLLLTEQARDVGVLAHRWPGAAGVEVLASTTGPGQAVLVTPHGGRGARVPELADGVAVLRSEGRAGVRAVRGERALSEQVAGRAFRVSAPAFWQVHPQAAPVLVAAVLEACGPLTGRRVYDLYAGVGLFSAALADAGAEVEAVESDPVAVKDAVHNLEGLAVRVHRGAVQELLGGLGPADLAVLDPPRTGAGPEVCAALAERVRERLVYVSCDPATLARDCAQLAGLGWSLRSVRGFDAFPMTAHVECLAVLERQ